LKKVVLFRICIDVIQQKTLRNEVDDYAKTLVRLSITVALYNDFAGLELAM